MHTYSFYVSRVLILGFCISLFSACKTEDIKPQVSVSITQLPNSTIPEENGTAVISASLNGKAKDDVKLNFSFGGTAVSGKDYNITASEILIKGGLTTGSITISSITNQLVEGDKTIIISLISANNADILNAFSDTITISEDDKDTDGDGVLDKVDNCPNQIGIASNNGCPEGFIPVDTDGDGVVDNLDSCDNVVGPANNNGCPIIAAPDTISSGIGLIINEVLNDPPDGLAGDANGDGIRDPTQDEFIELFNNSNSFIRLDSFMIYDSVLATNLITERTNFPKNTILAPKKALVIFGGGTAPGEINGSIVIVDKGTAGLSLGNTGETILIKDKNNKTILKFDTDALSDNPNESFSRSPDITGDFVQHGTIPLTPKKLFSPGTKTDGSAF